MERVNAPTQILLDKIDVGNPELFRDYTFWPYFEQLRKEDPVHYCSESMFGPYWSVTKYKNIMEVETESCRVFVGG